MLVGLERKICCVVFLAFEKAFQRTSSPAQAFYNQNTRVRNPSDYNSSQLRQHRNTLGYCLRSLANMLQVHT